MDFLWKFLQLYINDFFFLLSLSVGVGEGLGGCSLFEKGQGYLELGGLVGRQGLGQGHAELSQGVLGLGVLLELVLYHGLELF